MEDNKSIDAENPENKKTEGGRITRNIIPVLVLARELIAMLKKEYHFE